MARSKYGYTGIYNATPITLSDGEGAAAGLDLNGYSLVTLATNIAGEDITADVLKVEHRYSFTNMTTATTTTIKSGVGLLHAVIVGKAVAAGTIAMYNNTAGSGTLIGTITFGATLLTDPPLTAIYDVSFSIGLTIVTSQATDITICYR